MSRNKDIVDIKHIMGISLGLVAALVILISQSFYFDYVANVEGKAQMEQTSDIDSEETVIKMAHQALSSIGQFAVQNILHFISQIYLEDNFYADVTIENNISFDSFFQTLFRLIISPNAP